MTVKLPENQNAQKDYLNQKLIESQLLQKNGQFRLKQSAEVISKLILSVPLKREKGSSQGKHSAYPDMPGNSETWWKEDKPQNAVLPGFQIHKNSRLGHNGGRMSWCDV